MAVEKIKGVWTIKGKIKKDDGTYYNYKRIVPHARIKADAQAYEVDFKRNYQDIQKSLSQITFKELGIEYQENSKSIKKVTLRTDKDVLSKINEVIGDKKINLITKDILQKFINNMEKQYSQSYVSKIYYTINKVYKYAVDNDYVQVNPMSKVKRSLNKDVVKKEMLFWEPEHFKSFISVVDDLEMKTLFSFLYYMGCRKGEAVALQWKDIDFDKNTVAIYKSVTNKLTEAWAITTPKTKNSIRNISMPQTVKSLLEGLKMVAKQYYGFSDECFVFGFNRPLAAETLRKRFNRYIKKANEKITDKNNMIPEIRIHDLRHSHASYLINNMSSGFTDFDIAKRLGDTVQTLHGTYAHWFKQADKNIIDFMNNNIK